MHICLFHSEDAPRLIIKDLVGVQERVKKKPLASAYHTIAVFLSPLTHQQHFVGPVCMSVRLYWWSKHTQTQTDTAAAATMRRTRSNPLAPLLYNNDDQSDWNIIFFSQTKITNNFWLCYYCATLQTSITNSPDCNFPIRHKNETRTNN